MTLETTPALLSLGHNQLQHTSWEQMCCLIHWTLNLVSYSASSVIEELIKMILLFFWWSTLIIIIAVLPPPVDVRATQSSPSAPVEVSWSPPSYGASSITGYRIFYGSGQNVFIPSIAIITSVSLKVDRSYIGQNVSIRSESDQLYSELVNVSVTAAAAGM